MWGVRPTVRHQQHQRAHSHGQRTQRAAPVCLERGYRGVQASPATSTPSTAATKWSDSSAASCEPSARQWRRTEQSSPACRTGYRPAQASTRSQSAIFPGDVTVDGGWHVGRCGSGSVDVLEGTRKDLEVRQGWPLLSIDAYGQGCSCTCTYVCRRPSGVRSVVLLVFGRCCYLSVYVIACCCLLEEEETSTWFVRLRSHRWVKAIAESVTYVMTLSLPSARVWFSPAEFEAGVERTTR